MEHELRKEVKVNSKPVDEKLKRLKGLIEKKNFAKADIEKNKAITRRLFQLVINPLAQLIDARLDVVKPYFNGSRNKIVINHKTPDYDILNFDLEAIFKSEEDIGTVVLDFNLEGFNRAGINIFNVLDKLHIHLGKNTYAIGPDDHLIWEEKVYGQMHEAGDLHHIADRFLESVLEKINERAEQIVQDQNN